MKKYIKIYIVEDNYVYAESLKIFLKTRFTNILQIQIFCIGELCIKEMSNNPDIVIMDYYLNSRFEEAQNGLEIIKYIKIQNPETEIIVLSSQGNYTVIYEAIRVYDCFYVQKDEETFNKIEHLINNFNYRKNTVFVPLI